MQYYIEKHQHTCGADLHGRNVYLCILDSDHKVLLHRRVPCDAERLLRVLEPYREDLVIGVECMFKWYWLADFCIENAIPFVLGHALEMKAVSGAKSGNDRIDAERIGRLLQAGMFPMAYVYPREMRSTRDLLRRRSYHVHQRSNLMNHIQIANSQYNLPPLGKINEAKKQMNIEARFEDPSVRTAIEADLAVIDILDVTIARMEKVILQQAKVHNHHAFQLLKSVNGIGDIIGLTLLYEIHDIRRFDSLQGFSSYSCVVKCEKTSNNKFKGRGSSKRGNHYLKWAFREAAVLFLRGNPAGQKLHSRLVKKHGNAKALAVLSAKIARSVYFMLLRNTPFDIKRMVDA